MSAERFDLIFEGEIEPGYDPDEAHRTLESLFEFDAETRASLYNGQPVLLGRNMDAASADSFKQALASVGVTTCLLADNGAAEENQSECSPDRRSATERRATTQRRARVRSTAILPDRRKGQNRRS